MELSAWTEANSIACSIACSMAISTFSTASIAPFSTAFSTASSYTLLLLLYSLRQKLSLSTVHRALGQQVTQTNQYLRP